MSHVFPPGYRSGLRCGMVETLTAGNREVGNSMLMAIHIFSVFLFLRFDSLRSWVEMVTYHMSG